MFFLFLIIQIIINVFHSARIQNICEINRTKRIDSVDDIEKVVETNKKDIESIKKDIEKINYYIKCMCEVISNLENKYLE